MTADTKAAALAAVARMTDALPRVGEPESVHVCVMGGDLRMLLDRIAELEAERAGLVAAERERDILCTENAALKREAHTWSKAAEHYAKPRQPLSREQIDAVMTEHYPLLSILLREKVDDFEKCVRDLERLHGIGA
jgi:hypothetical protein